eukprot:SM000028S10101  [mRNA]  locus=s28:357584:359289:- [translate_table: standard]
MLVVLAKPASWLSSYGQTKETPLLHLQFLRCSFTDVRALSRQACHQSELAPLSGAEHVPELEVAERGGEHTEALERLLELHALGDRLLGFRLRHAAGVSGLSGLSGDSIARQQQAMCEERAEAGYQRTIRLTGHSALPHHRPQHLWHTTAARMACHTETVDPLKVAGDAVVEILLPQEQLSRLPLAGAEERAPGFASVVQHEAYHPLCGRGAGNAGGSGVSVARREGHGGAEARAREPAGRRRGSDAWPEPAGVGLEAAEEGGGRGRGPACRPRPLGERAVTGRREGAAIGKGAMAVK